MNSATAAKSLSLPALQVTPAMVRQIVKRYHIKVTDQDATQWLGRHKKQIEEYTV
jgi:hypothetical protein